MTIKQIDILNAMVTYVVENVPGGPSDDEREVAEIVGRWALANDAIPSIYSLAQVKAILMYGRLEGAPATAEEVIRTMIEHKKLPDS